MITRNYRKKMDLFELQNITFSYPEEEKAVLNDLSLTISVGQSLVIQGDNGAGKTTLFRILNGLLFPERGKYYFDGKEITKEYLKDNRSSKIFHQQIGYLFQNPDIMLFNGKVYDEIAFGPRQMGLSKDVVNERVHDCMRLFNIEQLSDKAPYHLSGGQKKRVALASVLALNPSVLILDEPFAGLDKKSKEELLDFLLKWKSCGKTLIIASHEDDLIKPLKDVEFVMS